MSIKKLLTICIPTPVPAGGDKKKVESHGKHIPISNRLIIGVGVTIMVILLVFGYIASHPATTYAPEIKETQQAELVKTEPATSSQQAGQETIIETGSYVPIDMDNIKDIPIYKLSEKIVFSTFYIRDLKSQGEYYVGFLGFPDPQPLSKVRLDAFFIDKEGKKLPSGLEVGFKSQQEYVYSLIDRNGLSLKEGQEVSVRIKKPAGASFLQVETGG